MMRKILSVMLAALLLITVFAACTPTTDPTEPSTEEPTQPQEPVRLANNGSTTYAIYCENNDEYDAAYALKTVFDAVTGSTIDIKKQSPGKFYRAIIVGRSSMESPDTYTVDADELGNGYIIKEIDSSFIITGTNPDATFLAVNRFVKDIMGFDVTTDTKIEKNKTLYAYKGMDIAVKSEESSAITVAGKDISDFTIVYSNDNGAEVEKAVSSYLKSALEKMTHKTIAVSNDASTIDDKSKVILLGQTSIESDCGFSLSRAGLADGEYVIVANDNGLLIAGKDAHATVSAVFDFLENVIGYTDAGYAPSLPTKKTVIESGFTRKGNVKFNILGEYEFDYTALRANNSKFTGDTVCFSDEAAMDKIRRNIKAKSRTARDKISCVYNAYAIPCTCDACKKAAEEEGTPYGAYFRFVNSVADAVAETNPYIVVEILAYKNTYIPPKTQLRDNVRVVLCNEYIDYNGNISGACSGHAVNDTTCKTNTAFLETLQAWLNVSKHVYILDMSSDYYYYPATFPNWKLIYDNMKCYYDMGVEGVYFQTENSSQNQIFLEFRYLREYVLRQFEKDPTMDRDTFNKHLDEYLTKAFGNYASSMREYIDKFSEAANTHCYNIYTKPEDILSISRKDGKGAESYDLTLVQQLFNCFNNSIPVYEALDKNGTYIGKMMINYLRSADRSSNVEHARTQFSKWLNSSVHPFDETEIYNVLIKAAEK